MSIPVSYSLKNIINVSAGWLGWTIIHCIIIHRLGYSWEISAADALVSDVLIGAACFVTMMVYRFYQPGVGNKLFRVIFAVGITLLISNAFIYIMSWLYPLDLNYMEFLQVSLPVRFIFSLLLLSFVTILVRMMSNLREQASREARRAEAEQLIKDAELSRLRQQLQPHFLFNSLNSISALAGKPTEARLMIQQLSDFLRGTLKKDDQFVSLDEELAHLKLYLAIEKVRFGHRLEIEIEIATGLGTLNVPALILQPIVENAIKFGLYGTLGNIVIRLSGTMQEMLVLQVINPFDPDSASSGRGTGFGLASVSRRLQLLYSRTDLLVTEQKDNNYITTLKIPQK